MKPQIHSEKHVQQYTVTTVGLGAIGQANPVLTVASADADAVNEVVYGTTVKAIYLELWVTSDDAAQGSAVISVEKRTGSSTAMTYAQSIALNSYPNKKNVFFVTQGLTPTNVGTPTPFFRGWIKIPKGKQRFALGDSLTINLSGISNGINYCGLCIYKAYT